VTDLKALVTNTVTQVPVLQTVSSAVGTISGVATSLSSVSTALTGLPTLITSKVKTLVDTQFAKAGILIPDSTTPSPNDSGTVATSGPADNESGSGYGENAYGENAYGENAYGENAYGENAYGENAYGENAYGENAYGETTAGGGKKQGQGYAPFTIKQFGSGSAEYELVTLSKPVSDPLFVHYKGGKPTYFTRGAKGVTILTNRTSSHTRRRKHSRS
jgi:hypothetical protein